MMGYGAVIYTDGACSNNGRHGASAGIGVFWPDHPHLNVSRRIGGRPTNQRAEIIAATEGIELAKCHGYYSVIIKADSHYVIKAATEWIPNWNRYGWNNITNCEEFLGLEAACEDMRVEFKYVPSAQNHADYLAKQAVRGVCMKRYFHNQTIRV